MKSNEYKMLLSSYIEQGYNRICVSGISGLGKSETIRAVCKDYKNKIWINYNFSLFDSSFKEILASKIRAGLETTNHKTFYVADNLSITERIFSMLDVIENSYKLILTFENISDANECDVSFICELLKFSRLTSKFIIIIEEDTDCKNSINYKKIKESTIFKTLSFSKYNKTEIKEYFCEQFECTKLEISERDLEHIYIASEGTFSIANVIINELEQLHLIFKSNNTLTIRSLPTDFLINGIEPYILKRFNNMKEEYKIILAKSSCLGFLFNCEDMLGIFSIAKIFDKLKSIEDASHLISEIEEEEFCFESKEAHKTINELSDEYFDKTEILKNIADYYKHSLTVELKNNDYARYITNLCLSKELYENINDTPNILKCYQLLIGNKMETKLFPEALKLCYEYDKLCTDKSLKFINQLQKLKCLIEIEDYKNGVELSNKLQRKNSAYLPYLKFYSALSYYGISDGKKALSILNKLLVTIEKDKDTLLYVKTIRLMSSIYDFYDEWDNQLRYFTEAITICKEYNLEHEYYSMLRQSGMVYPYEIALSMCKSAENYFISNNDIKELAKVTHNIATDAMYMLDIPLAYNKCQQSIQHFKSIGNSNIANPLNLMGILLCVEEKNYTEAINYFNNCSLLHSDKWTKCIGYLNAATAYRKLGDTNNFYKLINMTKQLNNNTMPLITVSTKLCELLYYFEEKDFTTCKNIAMEILNLDIELEFRHKYIIICILEKIGSKHSIVLDNPIELKTNFINSTCIDYLDKCIENNYYWATTRFWEN